MGVPRLGFEEFAGTSEAVRDEIGLLGVSGVARWLWLIRPGGLRARSDIWGGRTAYWQPAHVDQISLPVWEPNSRCERLALADDTESR